MAVVQSSSDGQDRSPGDAAGQLESGGSGAAKTYGSAGQQSLSFGPASMLYLSAPASASSPSASQQDASGAHFKPVQGGADSRQQQQQQQRQLSQPPPLGGTINHGFMSSFLQAEKEKMTAAAAMRLSQQPTAPTSATSTASLSSQTGANSQHKHQQAAAQTGEQQAATQGGLMPIMMMPLSHMPDNMIGQAYNAAVGQALPIESGTSIGRLYLIARAALLLFAEREWRLDERAQKPGASRRESQAGLHWIGVPVSLDSRARPSAIKPISRHIETLSSFPPPPLIPPLLEATSAPPD